jgi:hypothetical protein
MRSCRLLKKSVQENMIRLERTLDRDRTGWEEVMREEMS